ncbi:hypothetical protein [Mycobacterium aquaticum]|uniref:Uncharacterized protein n=1 Tax=Mycobacterium aquaticum TaxID=1927124 RepID=A0A1X0ANF5_9MYCO|nr:hypothetical protein [Mycobacterium aquaticum]ORA31570.1 hypothetical protein BST13_24750 [Mycobacterium aquaticum]
MTTWRDITDELTPGQVRDVERVEPDWPADRLLMVARYYATLNIEYLAGVSAVVPPHYHRRDLRYRRNLVAQWLWRTFSTHV